MSNQTAQRRLLRVSGNDRVAFLQGLITNDVNKISDGLVYAAILTPQGKFFVDFFLALDGDTILLDVNAAHADALASRLSMYKLRADVSLDWDDRVVSCGINDAPAGALRDPRHTSLGWRSYGALNTSTEVEWDALRVAACIPETGVELTSDTFILEAGFERLNGVDFRKGCYVGQEVTARMKHKTALRKGLTRVNIAGDAVSGTEITSNGKPAGVLHTRSGDQAIAYARFDRLSEGGLAGTATITLAD